MSFDLDAVRAAVLRHGRVTRVVIAATYGSAPREVGAAMLVWDAGQSGTVGGGALEYELARAARAQVVPTCLSRHALGPDMGQCCGGAVEVVSEVYDAARLATLEGRDVIARPVTGGDDTPLAVRRRLARARWSTVSRVSTARQRSSSRSSSPSCDGRCFARFATCTSGDPSFSRTSRFGSSSSGWPLEKGCCSTRRPWQLPPRNWRARRRRPASRAAFLE